MNEPYIVMRPSYDVCTRPARYQTKHHNKSTIGKNHAFVRLLKPYKCYRKPCGNNEYVFKRVSMNCSQNIDPSYRKVCRYPCASKTAMWKSVLVPPYGKTVPIPPYGKLCSYPHVLYYYCLFFLTLHTQSLLIFAKTLNVS